MAAPASAQSAELPTRSPTDPHNLTDDEAVPDEDTSEVTRLFSERLSAWKHAIAYLEGYISATEKLHKDTGKEYDKVLKTVSHPLKYGHHFDQQLGGVAGMFDNIRSNTQGLSQANAETAKTIKGSVLPTFERLHSEIKHKSKELTKGAGKASKAVDKARNSTQKHIELLGQHTASFDSSGGKLAAHDDPYVLQRGVMYRLNKQVIEENNNRQDLIAVQNSFAQFEAHIIQSIQQGLGQFNSVVSKQADATRSMYGDLVGNAQRIPPDFEWNGFIKRNDGVLIDPSAPPRSLSGINFPNQNHRATVPLIAGSLDRKSKLLRRYETAYWVVTPSKYLHEFKSEDNFGKEPAPETSLYLPDCAVGALDGDRFAVKGKDMSKGKLGTAVGLSHDYQFRAHTPMDAQKWWEVIRMAAGQVTDEAPETSAPSSPVATAGGGFGSGGAAASEAGAGATGAQTLGEGEKTAPAAQGVPTGQGASAGAQHAVAAGDHAHGQAPAEAATMAHTGTAPATGTTAAPGSAL